MTAPRVLRKYQVEAADAVQKAHEAGAKTQRVGVVLPTGTGKSSVIGETARRAYRRGEPIVMLAHRAELLDQMVDNLRAVDPTIPGTDIGIVRAEKDDHHCRVVAATLQTLASAKRLNALGPRAMILWDEVHHAGADGFNTTFSELGGYSTAKMAGFTATMNRDEKSKVGLGDVIQKVVYEKDIRWAIKEGYLVKPVGLTVRIEGLDALNDIRNVAGDFNQGELSEVMEAATEYVVEAVNLHAADRRPIVFAASVDAAHHIAEALTDSGFPAVAVTGAMGYEERKVHYEAYRSGEVKALVTVMVLTEGADFPMCDAVVMARPTRSRNLYSQMIGRALRLYPGKVDAKVIDLAGSSRSMSLINLTKLDTGADVSEYDTNGNELDPLEAEYDDTEDVPDERLIRQGPVDLTTIDLLKADNTLWLETPGGVPFINLMQSGEIVFVWPFEGRRPTAEADTTWAVGQINTRTGVGGWVSASGRFAVPEPDHTDLETALENAQVWIVETEQQLPKRDSPWRRNQPPSDAQLNYARNLRIAGYADMTKARLSDEISVKLAARTLDRGLVK